jgi:hypothetical protein
MKARAASIILGTVMLEMTGRNLINYFSINELKNIHKRIPEYEEIKNKEEVKGDHYFESDSNMRDYSQIKGHLDPRSKRDKLIDEFNQMHSNLADRITNSQSYHLNQKEYDPNEVPDKLFYSDLKPRRYTQELYDEHQYNPANNVYAYQQDMTGTTFEMDYSLLDPHEPLIIDHGIMKFHPGFSINYVCRWVQVTKTVIRFYKNYYHSVCSFRRPLVVIPMSAISKVKKIKFVPKSSNATKVMNKGNKNPYDNNQFEIELKEDYEAIYDLNKRKKEVEDLRYELELIQKLEYQNNLKKQYKNYRKKCHLSKSPIPTFKLFMQSQREEIKKLSRSHPRLSVYSRLGEEEFAQFEAKTNKSFEHLKVSHHPNFQDHSIISKGRQSRLEASGDRSVISIDEQYLHSSCSRSKSKRKAQKKSAFSNKRCKTPFDSTVIVDGHLMPIRVNKQDRNGHSAFRPITKKKVPKVHWSKRETDWFKFERR